jgi:choline dehydrogenase-like flavoprotein
MVRKTHVNRRQIPHPRGKVLGGSSAINFGAMVYPSKANFEAWKELGNEGWDAAGLAPYFRKSSRFTPPGTETKELLGIDYIKDELHGKDGPLPVTIPDIYGPFQRSWVEVMDKLGWCNPDDPIEGEKVGNFACGLSIDAETKTRGYAASAYYTPEVANRSNIEVLTEAFVEKILTRSADGSVVATGVKVRTKDGMCHEITAKKEVILSAGAIQSPLVLELSGIGQKELLEKHGIPVVLDSPGVGENLQDHVISAPSFEIADDQISADILRDPTLVQAVLQQYMTTKTGPLVGIPMTVAMLPLVDSHGRLSSEEVSRLTQRYVDDADIPVWQKKQYEQLYKQILGPKEATGYLMMLPLQLNMSSGRTEMKDLLAPTNPKNQISILAVINHPFSRGVCHIRSADPQDRPILDPRYLSHPLDLEILARYTQYVEKIVETEPLASLLKPSERLREGKEATSLEAAKEMVKERMLTTFHPTSTCAMMPKEVGGVVDSRLKVYGTKNLRVVDASVFPMETSGNIQATVYAVAEKAADLIREDHAA